MEDNQIKQLVGDNLVVVRNDSLEMVQFNEVNIDVLQKAKLVCFYFGAKWAPPCRLFTQSLKDFYDAVN